MDFSKYNDQPEFQTALKEMFSSLDDSVLNNPRYAPIIEKIIEPDRIITFDVNWVDDKGEKHTNKGYRIQFNNANGVYKGGLRFHKSVSLSILKFLGFEQTFKNSLTGLPMGGGKGGADFDPRGKSDAEVMRFCQSLMTELFRHIGPNTDVPAGDLGVGAREIGYMFGYYKKLRDEWSGTFTGKNFSYGGSLARPEATGYGLLYFVEEMLKEFKKTSIKGKKVIISGSGKVGGMAAAKLAELGGILVGMSDIEGFVYDPNGLDVPYIVEQAKAKGMFSKAYAEDHKGIEWHEDPHKMWGVAKCEIALPCATQGEIHEEDAKLLKKNGCYMLVEGANMPCDVEAIRFFNNNGILFAPGKASNAGGVAVSGLEMSQNALHLSWTFEEVDARLKQIMKDIFKKCHETAVKYGQPTNLALGANIAGFEKVLDAMLAQGVC